MKRSKPFENCVPSANAVTARSTTSWADVGAMPDPVTSPARAALSKILRIEPPMSRRTIARNLKLKISPRGLSESGERKIVCAAARTNKETGGSRMEQRTADFVIIGRTLLHARSPRFFVRSRYGADYLSFPALRKTDS